jgi:glycosyltransferase involved in cell wall biosynthesis
MDNPLVSVIVPTKNSAKFLSFCLDSLNRQTYRNLEIIVVDNDSADDTKEIARRYTDRVFNHGPERSAQVNYGASLASGEFIYKVDSDFVLDPEVIAQGVAKIAEGFDAVVVHNTPDASVSWIAKIRKFEVDMYKYDLTYSSARFVKRDVYWKIGGYNAAITAGEDYDFQNKLNRNLFKTGFIDAEAIHLGEPTKLWKHLVKYYRYGRDFINYQQANAAEAKEQLGFFRSVYFKNWKKFVCHPWLGAEFIIYDLLKFNFGALGYLAAKLSKV